MEPPDTEPVPDVIVPPDIAPILVIVPEPVVIVTKPVPEVVIFSTGPLQKSQNFVNSDKEYSGPF